MDALICLCLYFLVDIFKRFAVKKREKRILLLCSITTICLWALSYGMRDFYSFNVWILCLALVIAYILYLVSLFVVGTKLSYANLFPTKAYTYRGTIAGRFRKESVLNLFYSTYEELLYRWFIQNALFLLTNSALISVGITIVLFFSIHIRKQRAVVQLIDIFIFSTAISLWFYFVPNPIYGCAIHILRNQLIINQKYIELGETQIKKNKYLYMLRSNKSNGQ